MAGSACFFHIHHAKDVRTCPGLFKVIAVAAAERGVACFGPCEDAVQEGLKEPNIFITTEKRETRGWRESQQDVRCTSVVLSCTAVSGRRGVVWGSGRSALQFQGADELCGVREEARCAMYERNNLCNVLEL